MSNSFYLVVLIYRASPLLLYIMTILHLFLLSSLTQTLPNELLLPGNCWSMSRKSLCGGIITHGKRLSQKLHLSFVNKPFLFIVSSTEEKTLPPREIAGRNIQYIKLVLFAPLPHNLPQQLI